RNRNLLMFLATLGVGMFVVIGTHKTLMHDFNTETALIMGTISAVLGGILRSAYNKERSILVNKELYATVAAISSLICILLSKANVDLNLSAIVVIIATCLVRYLSIKYKVHLPTIK